MNNIWNIWKTLSNSNKILSFCKNTTAEIQLQLWNHCYGACISVLTQAWFPKPSTVKTNKDTQNSPENTFPPIPSSRSAVVHLWMFRLFPEVLSLNIFMPHRVLPSLAGGTLKSISSLTASVGRHHVMPFLIPFPPGFALWATNTHQHCISRVLVTPWHTKHPRVIHNCPFSSDYLQAVLF